MAFWNFNALPTVSSGTVLNPTSEDVRGTPILQQFFQVIDSNGKDGTPYTDMNGVVHTDGQAIAWDDVRGPGSDAELLFTVNTTDWQDVQLRFDYRVNPNDNHSFDLSYSTDGGFNYVPVITNQALINDDVYHPATVDLSAENALENKPFVLIRISGLGDPGNNVVRFDNFELTGTKTPPNPNGPTIVFDDPTTTPFLSLNATGAGFVSGVLGDPTDPASTLGIAFTVADPDTPLANLTVTATSSVPAVANPPLNLAGAGATRTLTITPLAVGITDITVTVSDGTSSDTYLVRYAVSAASSTPATSRYHTGASDASAAVAIDANFMFVADDEDQVIRLYDRNDSGEPLASFDFTSVLGLPGQPQEVDIEGATRVGNLIYWIGSQSNASADNNGEERPNRNRLFATNIVGAGATATLTFAGRYDFLENDLIAWDQGNINVLGLATSSAPGVVPEMANGYNIEGLAMAPNSTTTAYVAFRAPQEPTTTRTRALIVPVTNFAALAAGGQPIGTAQFGTPIQLDLGGRGIRSIDRNANNEYVIIAGPSVSATGTAPNDFRLYTWTGSAGDQPVLRTANLLPAFTQTGGSYEALVEVPDNLGANTPLQLLLDNGDTNWYGTGISKDLAQTTWQKARSDVIVLGAAANTPPSFTIAANPPAVNEDAGAQTVNNFATNVTAGEAGQTLTFNVTNNTNAALFGTAPAVSATGVLTYTPAANVNGTAMITVTLMDNGGGTDTSPPQTFTITVNAVNDAPTFTLAGNQTVAEDAGARTVTNFLTNFVPGPADEAAQTLGAVTATIMGTTGGLTFSQAPAIAANGTLTYAAAANRNGTATIQVTATDSAGATSAPLTFMITVTAVNDAPTFTLAGNQTSAEDAGLQTVPNFATFQPGPATAADEANQTPTYSVAVASTTGGLTFSQAPAISANGTLTYRATPNSNGTATVMVIVSDSAGAASGQQPFTITVTGVPEADVTVSVGSGGGQIDLTTGQQATTTVPFAGFGGEVRVASGDVTGDGVPDTVYAAGPGAPGGHVKVFDGVTNQEVRSFFAFEGFLGGVFVASGDVNGDGRDDLIVSADAGALPHVKVFSAATGALLLNFLAYDPAFVGGVRVAAGDVNGDGRDDVITGNGAGAVSNVRVFSGRDGAQLASFNPYDTFTSGVFVGAGDVNRDGRADIITGSGPGVQAHVKVFNGRDLSQLDSFFAFDPGFLGGVRVGSDVVNGIQAVLAGAGPGAGPHVKAFDVLNDREIVSIFAGNPSFSGGVYIS